MIRRETAMRIYNCYGEIVRAKELLKDIEKQLERKEDPVLKDVFGNNHRTLELGIPSGESGRQLYRVQPKLATSVIRAHIANQEAELVEANEQARIELDMNNSEVNT